MARILGFGAFLLGAALSDKLKYQSKPNVVLIVDDDYGKVDFLNFFLTLGLKFNKKVTMILGSMEVRSKRLIWINWLSKREYD